MSSPTTDKPIERHTDTTLTPDCDPMGAAISDHYTTGHAARLRVLSTVFDEDGYTMTTGVTETRWQYAQILAIAETKRYFILALSKNHAQAVDKEGIQGGSAEEFRAFITEKTGKPVTYIKK